MVVGRWVCSYVRGWHSKTTKAGTSRESRIIRLTFIVGGIRACDSVEGCSVGTGSVSLDTDGEKNTHNLVGVERGSSMFVSKEVRRCWKSKYGCDWKGMITLQWM